MTFLLKAPFKPVGDQPQAIFALTQGVEKNIPFQELLGVTGSGKTFTVANVIANTKLPALILSHNKTLGAQLYEELKEFFPKNSVHYFVSYYDYYQPESYIPQTDTYIEKDVKINEELDRLRHASTQAVLSRKDVIVVASVSAIYNIGSPQVYQNLSLNLTKGQKITSRQILDHLLDMQYERNDIELLAGTFRLRGERFEIVEPTGEKTIIIEIKQRKINFLGAKGMGLADPIKTTVNARIFPAKFWVSDKDTMPLAITNIEAELTERLKELKKSNRLLEAQRLEQRTKQDIEMMRESGYCHGIENYSRHLEFRPPNSPPFTLLDYFQKAYGQNNWLTFIDESHQTIPQIIGMVEGDRSRKNILIEHGFRLPSAKDNRPLTFSEFVKRTERVIGSSATPGFYEKSIAKKINLKTKKVERGFVEQLIRPTGILDPKIEIRPTKGQLASLLNEIKKRTAKKERILITTITKRLAEEVAAWLSEQNIKVEYIHADIKTLERPEILHKMRAGEIDAVVGINLLREGLDLPEVSLVAILDADQEGFLRNETTLIQTIGRAARHINGRAILFADKITGSIAAAVKETRRRRKIQRAWNKKHKTKPRSIVKKIKPSTLIGRHNKEKEPSYPPQITPELMKQLKVDMKEAIKKLEFEKAARIRDLIKKLPNGN